MKKKLLLSLLTILCACTLAFGFTACEDGDNTTTIIGAVKYTLNSDEKSYSVTGIDTTTANEATISSEYEGLPVVSIGQYAFSDCASLVNLNIPDSITSIGNYAFHGCSSLSKLIIPNGVTTIGDHTLFGCTALTSIMLPDSITSIGSCAFQNCSSLTSIYVPDGVTFIGEHAFCNCTALTSIIIPDSVTSIGSGAFINCNSLTIYCEANEKPSGWYMRWNNSNRPVVWGYTGENN